MIASRSGTLPPVHRSYLTFDARLAWFVIENVALSLVGRDLAEARHREFAGGTEVARSVFGQVRTWW